MLNWEPKEYQVKAMQFALEHANCGLFMGMGSGKSSVVLGALTVLKAKKALRRAIIVAPSRVCNNVWPQEREKWDDFHSLTMSVLHGPKKDRLLEAFDHDVAVISVDSLAWAVKAGVFERVNPDVLIVDESSFLKSHLSQRFRIMRSLLPRFSRRIILTGTPSPNGAMDLWAQMYVVDRGGSLGEYITRYRIKYFVDVGYTFPDWQLAEGAEAKIAEAIKPVVFRADDPEVQALLPDVIHNTITVPLDPGTRALYARLEKDFFLALGQDVVMPPNAAALSQKLRMLCNGTVITTTGDAENPQRGIVTVHTEKLAALDSVVGEAGGKPLLVFYEFVADRDAICARYAAPYIGGGVSDTDAMRLVSDFNKGKIPVLVVHPRSAGFGLNLQEACSEAVWYGPTWDCGVYEQAMARIVRQGQKSKSVTIHTIVTEGTIEGRVADALLGKVESQRELLAAIRR
jgi:SNF2 family DNA or RNA helicase